MLEKNLKGIARYKPQLAEMIRNHTVMQPYFFEVAQSEDVILFYNEVAMHSTVNPQQEAQDIYNNLSKQPELSTIHILYGLGLGYLFKRFYLSSPGKIVVYEPDLDVLRITLEAVDFSQELEDNRVMVINSEEDFDLVFKRLYSYKAKLDLTFLPAYKNKFQDRIQLLHDKIAYLKGYQDVTFYTLFEGSRDWANASLENIENILKSEFIDSLKGKFNKIPAIIVAAGPSLIKNIEQIKQYENRAIIFSVGNSARILTEEYNIIPNFAGFIDSSDNVESQFDGVTQTDKINFILQPPSYPGCFKHSSKRNFIYLASNDSVSNWMAEKLKVNNQKFSNQGTVSLTLLRAAYWFGCNPIITLGLDLSYTKDGRFYADKTIISDYSEDALIVKAWDGGTIQTNTSFATFIHYCEHMAKDIGKEVRIINSTEGGAYLNGFEHMLFADSGKLIPENILDIEAIITNATADYINPLKAHRLNLLNAIKESHDALKKLSIMVNNNLGVLNKISIELKKSAKSNSYISKLFHEFYKENTGVGKLLNNQCRLLLPYIQKELYEFNTIINKSYLNMNSEEISELIRLGKVYYTALQENIPGLRNLLNKNLVQK